MSREAVTVEFVGTPGAGKTTLASDLVRALRCRGVVADTIVSAANSLAFSFASGFDSPTLMSLFAAATSFV